MDQELEDLVTAADGIDFPHAATAGVTRRDEFDNTGTRISREYALMLTSAHPTRTRPPHISTPTYVSIHGSRPLVR